MTATITRPKPKKAAANKPQSLYKRLHVIIPIEDMLWASQQKPSVTQLWQECWTADPYGSRWMPLISALGYSTFICAKKILADSGLFIFKPDKSIQDGRETVKWMVQNLHGSRMKEFWEKANAEKREPNSEKQESNAEKRESNAGDSEIDAGSEEMGALYEASISGESQSEQRFCEPSRTAQEQLTNSSKEFVNCVSDTLTRISREEETAIAPLGGASPLSVQSVSELEEDLPVAMDCTTLTLVDAVQGESASLIEESQDCGDETKNCYEGTCSAAPVPQPEKWSHEAIVARSNLRPERMQKLKVAANSLQNPGFDFLQECWDDDPALQIVIKKLLAKFPQWGIAIVDGVLVKWNK